MVQPTKHAAAPTGAGGTTHATAKGSTRAEARAALRRKVCSRDNSVLACHAVVHEMHAAMSMLSAPVRLPIVPARTMSVQGVCTGVCIVHQQASDKPGLLDKECLARAGYTVRVSKNCLPDLIISRAGTTAAFLLTDGQAIIDNKSGTWDRQALIAVFTVCVAPVLWHSTAVKRYCITGLRK